MNVESYVSRIASQARCEEWLAQLGIQNVAQGFADISNISDLSIPHDLFNYLLQRLDDILRSVVNPDQALEKLAQFLSACRSPISVCSMFERDDEALPLLLQLFVRARGLADSLITDPESFDLIRMSSGRPVERSEIVSDITNEISAIHGREAIRLALRRFTQREKLRIAFGEIHCQHSLETVTTQLSHLADSICEAGLVAAKSIVQEKRGHPRRFDNQIADMAIIGLGRLGGRELNYADQIDLVFLYDFDGKSDGKKSVPNSEYFELVATEFLHLMSDASDDQVTYDINLSLRPKIGQSSQIVFLADQASLYFGTRGRTWERQSYIKARHVAGDARIGDEFVTQMNTWVFRRYLNRADVTELKSLKRRTQSSMRQHALGEIDKSIASIESVVTFLQLLNGGNNVKLQKGNVLDSIASLAEEGCVRSEEHVTLDANYRFFRQFEHRHQQLFDHNQFGLPDSPTDRVLFAQIVGWVEQKQDLSFEDVKVEIETRCQENREILDRLLEDAFSDDSTVAPEVDLILDPKPTDEFITQTLKKYGFHDIRNTYDNLVDLATEHIPFLSTRRCRAFFSQICPAVLTAVDDAPDPDETLNNLARVSDSLGGKGVLWELFSFSPATLDLYVKLCAGSPYLSSILTSYPGMLDDLMDSLVRSKLPDHNRLRTTLEDRIRSPESVEPILHNFKSSQHLTAGVRDILGQDDVTDSMRFLSDVAESCLESLIQSNNERLIEKFGAPLRSDGTNAELIVLALGKLGAQEPNYHSNFDLLFLYDEDGATKHRGSRSKKTTSNQHFFNELAQRVLKQTNHFGRFGRLFEVDVMTNLMGQSGLHAVPISSMVNLLQSGDFPTPSRQVLTRARPIFGDPNVRRQLTSTIRHELSNKRLTKSDVQSIYDDRLRREQDASPHNLKRGVGGTLDIEYLVEMTNLTHATFQSPQFSTGTINGLRYFANSGILPETQISRLIENYRFLRHVEARLRLMNTSARHDLPTDTLEMRKLSYLLSMDEQEIRQTCLERMKENRSLFREMVGP